MNPEVLSQLLGGLISPTTMQAAGADGRVVPVRGFTPNQQGALQQTVQQMGAFPGDSGPEGELLRRLLEVERTRKLAAERHDAQTGRASGIDLWDIVRGASPLQQPGYVQ